MQGDRTTGEHGSQDEMLAVLQLAGCVLQDEGVAAEEKKVNSAGQMKPSVEHPGGNPQIHNCWI